MIVKDLFQITNDSRVIARAIFEDHCSPQDIYGWITKYYAQLVKLKSIRVRKPKMMFYMCVTSDDDYKSIYASVCGYLYEDILNKTVIGYSIEDLSYRDYASLYVPDYTVQRYGEEVVASEALREYGWTGFDKKIECPDEVRLAVIKELYGMKQEIFLTDINYYDRCREQFCKFIEGKPIPQWDDARTAKGEKNAM